MDAAEGRMNSSVTFSLRILYMVMPVLATLMELIDISFVVIQT